MLSHVMHYGPQAAGYVSRACFSTISDKEETLKAMDVVIKHFNNQAEDCKKMAQGALAQKITPGGIMEDMSRYHFLAEKLETEAWGLKVQIDREKTAPLPEGYMSIVCKK